LLLNCIAGERNPPALTLTPPVSVTKPISEYMRNVGLLYIETVEGARNIEQLER